MAGDVTLGGLMTRTGTTDVDDHMERGALLAIDEINAAGGIDGLAVGYVSCDTEADATASAARVRELAQLGAPAVIGPSRSALALGVEGGTGAARAAIDAQVLLILAVGHLAGARRARRRRLRVPHRGVGLGPGPGPCAHRRARGLSRVLVLQLGGDPYTLGIREQFVAAFSASRGDDAAPFLSFDPVAPGGAAELLAAIDAADADGVLLASFPDEAQALVLAAADHDWGGAPPLWLMPDGMRSDAALSALETLVSAGVRVVGTQPATPVGAAYRAFARNHRLVFGASPEAFSAHAYDAVYLAAAAMLLASDPTDGAALRDAIRLTQPGSGSAMLGTAQWAEMRRAARVEGGFDYLGAAGEEDFDVQGDVMSGIEEWAIENSTFTHKRCWSPSGDACE